jgi:uncharacterized protein with von Willebrand factor type A (vWA) domain
MKKVNIKDEVLNVLVNELYRNENGQFLLLNNLDYIDLMVSKENIPTIKEKVLKMLEKLNSSTEEEIQKIFNSDFQEEIFDQL